MQSEEPLIYRFKFEGGWDNVYSFNTKHKVEYDVRFKPDANYMPLHELWRDELHEIVIEVISAPDLLYIPADPAIFPTLVAIISNFFAVHQRVVLYICDDSDSREMARKRKFDGWYARFGDSLFEKYDLPTVDAGSERYFASLIFRRDNHNRIAIITAFERLGTGDK